MLEDEHIAINALEGNECKQERNSVACDIPKPISGMNSCINASSEEEMKSLSGKSIDNEISSLMMIVILTMQLLVLPLPLLPVPLPHSNPQLIM
jgi:hypothetical protein